MIVFWRLFLTFFLTYFVFFHKTINQLEKENWLKASALHSAVFLFWAYLLCCAFHVFSDRFFQFGGKMRHGYVLTFFTKIFANLLFLFLCVPFRVLYETGNFFAESWVIFLVGLVTATRVIGWFIFSIEQDRYGRDYPTFDERWLLMMVRAIFFLIMLLPGWRWMVWLLVWYGACVYARKIRLMDVSHAAFYIGVFGAVLVGFLVRLRFYLVW